MTTRELLVSSDHLSRIAFANPGAVVTMTAEYAYLTLGGVTYLAPLPPVAGAS